MEQLATLEMIKREMNRKRINAAVLTRGLKISPSAVAGILQRPTIQVQRLAEISEFLNYNFFREIANKLRCTEPDYTLDTDRTEVNGLKSRVRDLELEVSILRQTIKDLAGR